LTIAPGLQSDDESSPSTTSDVGAQGVHPVRTRSSSFSVMVKTMSMKTIPSKLEVLSYKRSLGMSEALVNSDLKYAELGVIGDRISRMSRTTSTFLFVLHPPKDVPDRKRTMSDGGSRGVNTQDSSIDTTNMRERVPATSPDTMHSVETTGETHTV